MCYKDYTLTVKKKNEKNHHQKTKLKQTSKQNKNKETVKAERWN
jgi:hypothetical protein